MTYRGAIGVLLGCGATAAGLACGPSFQAIYEGNARFEHCYALEESAQTTVPEKADCWHDWSTRYTYGQTRDRIHYATARYVSLSQTVPTDEAMMMAAPGMTRRQSTITAPNPTNAFAPPPKVLDEPDASAGGASVNGGAGSSRPGSNGEDGGVASMPSTPSTPSTPALPASSCGDKCANTFRVCPAGPTCEKAYRGCMRACFK